MRISKVSCNDLCVCVLLKSFHSFISHTVRFPKRLPPNSLLIKKKNHIHSSGGCVQCLLPLICENSRKVERANWHPNQERRLRIPEGLFQISLYYHFIIIFRGAEADGKVAHVI